MKSKPTNIPESELVRNIIFLGTTGAGKSTTCNTLYGNPNGPFITSHDQVSGSESVVDKVSESKRIRLFDTPGFGDSGFDEREIDRMLRSLTSIFTDTRVDSTKQVDAFVLVVKLDPRAHSLKRDLERIKNLFGTNSLRSLVLLLIYDVKDGKARGKDFLHKLNKMEEVKRILKEGKHSEPSEDWFCVWDNLNPIPGQEEALFGKMKKLQPYTYNDFLESEKEVKHRIDSEMGSQLQREIEKVRGQYETNIELQRKQMQEFQERFEREKKELIEMRENAIANTAKIIAAINEISERTQSILSKLHGQIETEKEESAKKFLEIGQNKANPYSKQLEDYLKEHREMLRRFEASVEKKVENTTGAAAEVAATTEEAQEPKTLTTIFMELLGKKDEAGKQEKTKELLGATAKKGAETVAKKGAQEVATKGIIGLAKKACNMF